MPNNIYPDLSSSQFDVKYARLKVLAIDTLGRPGGTNRGSTSVEDDEFPPGPSGDDGCKKVYVANLTQSGSGNPVVTVFENTIGNIIWTRTGVGEFRGTLIGSFPADATWMMINQKSDLFHDAIDVRFQYGSTDYVYLSTSRVGSSAFDDDILHEYSIEIRTYCSSIVAPVEDLIQYFMERQTDGDELGIRLKSLAPGATGTINWGDGSGLYPFTTDGSSIADALHTYVSAGDYIVSIEFDDPTQFTYFSDAQSDPADGVDIQIGSSYTHNTTLLFSNGRFTSFPDLPDTVISLSFSSQPLLAGVLNCSVLPSVIQVLDLIDCTNITSLSNVPSTLTELNANFSTSIVSIDSLPDSIVTFLCNSPALTTIGSLGTLANCTNFSVANGQFNSAFVDSVLIALDSNGILNGIAQLSPLTPAASPGPSGAAAATNLTGKGWAVYTD